MLLPLLALMIGSAVPQLAVDERVYQAHDTKAYVIQYAYNPKDPVQTGRDDYLSTATILRIKRDRLIKIKVVKGVLYRRGYLSLEPEIKRVIEKGEGKKEEGRK